MELPKSPPPGLVQGGPGRVGNLVSLELRSVRDLNSDTPGPGAGGVAPSGFGGSQRRPRRGDPKYLGHAGVFKHVT